MKRRLAVVASALVVASGILAPSSSAREDPIVQDLAAKAYVETYGGTVEEATSRLEIQDRVTPSISKIQSILGPSFGGAWFDPDDGGQLKIGIADGTADPKQRVQVEDLLRAQGALDDDKEFVVVPSSLDELKDAQRVVDKEILTGRGGIVSSSFDVRTGTVTITRTSDADDVVRDDISTAKRRSPVPVRERVLPEGSPLPETRACVLPYCDRPLRGGIHMGEWAGGATHCTAGFNARSRSDNRRYLLTAGHCLTFGVSWDTKFVPWGAWHRIGETWNKLFPFGVDAGIIRVDGPAGEFNQSPFPGPYVAVDASGGTSYNESYYIGNEATYPPQGTTICVTGGGGEAGTMKFWHGTPYASWSWCGTVLQSSVTVMFNGSDVVNNLIETNICFHSGMSGGPAYKNNLSYGTITGDLCTWSGAQGWIYPTWLSENLMNVNIIH